MCPSNYYRFWDTAKLSEIFVKISSFYHTPLHSTPPLGGFPSEYRHPLWDDKLKWCRYPTVKKFRRYLYSFWRDPRTSRNVTDGRTDGQTLHDNKDRACIASRGKNGSCPMHEWDHPPIFWDFNSPPSAPRGRWTPQGGMATSADIVPTQIKFGVDPSTRCWDIAQKPPKCQNSPLTPIVTKISFPPFSVRRRPLTPKRGEDTSGTRVRPHANFGVNRPADCREIVHRTKKQTNKKTYSKTNTSPFALTSEWRVTTALARRIAYHTEVGR